MRVVQWHVLRIRNYYNPFWILIPSKKASLFSIFRSSIFLLHAQLENEFFRNGCSTHFMVRPYPPLRHYYPWWCLSLPHLLFAHSRVYPSVCPWPTTMHPFVSVYLCACVRMCVGVNNEKRNARIYNEIIIPHIYSFPRKIQFSLILHEISSFFSFLILKAGIPNFERDKKDRSME